MFCSNCGKEIGDKADFCNGCGVKTNSINSSNTTIINNINNGREKDKWIAFLLCFFFGLMGVHKFYEGKVGMGILYIFTGGLCGVGCIVDCIVLLCKPNKYYV